MRRAQVRSDTGLEQMLAVRQISKPSEKHPKTHSTTIHKKEVKKGEQKPPKLVKNRLKSTTQPRNVGRTRTDERVGFVQKLLEIENECDGNNKSTLLDATNEAIDTASRQLEELKKLLGPKLSYSDEITAGGLARIKRTNGNNEDVGVGTRNKSGGKCAGDAPKVVDTTRVDRLLEKMTRKPRVYYKSLKNFEHLTLAEPPPKPEQEERIKPNPKPQPIEDLYLNKNRTSEQSLCGIVQSPPNVQPVRTKRQKSHSKSTNHKDTTEDFYDLMFKNTKLEDSIRKSDFLLKEFSVDSKRNFRKSSDNMRKSKEKIFVTLGAIEEETVESDEEPLEERKIIDRKEKYETLFRAGLRNSLYQFVK